MNENTFHRRRLIKRGLALIAGTFFFGTRRSSFGATTITAEPGQQIKRARKGATGPRNCIEGVSLGLPMQDLGTNRD